MADILALAGGRAALNLGLAGIRVEEHSDMKDIERRCGELLDDGPDVLILEERYRDEFSERMQERLARHYGAPLLVFCPDFGGEASDVDAYLSSIIKPAVGFEIRLG